MASIKFVKSASFALLILLAVSQLSDTFVPGITNLIGYGVKKLTGVKPPLPELIRTTVLAAITNRESLKKTYKNVGRFMLHPGELKKAIKEKGGLGEALNELGERQETLKKEAGAWRWITKPLGFLF